MQAIHRIKELLSGAGISNVDKLRRFEYFSNPCETRRIYTIANELVVKVFADSEIDAYRIESHLLPLLKDEGVSVPVLLHSEDFGHEGSIIAMERAAGELLDDVYQALSADEYEKLLFALGREMRNFHRINAGRIDEALLKEGSCDSHRSCAEEYSRDLANNPEHFSNENLLSSYASEVIKDLIQQHHERFFSSSRALSHTDIHNENVFLDTSDSESYRCTLIDLESVIVQEIELDFVHPYMNIIGEAFPQRRLYEHTENPSENRFLAAFESGYGNKIDWEVVTCHLICWHLDWARNAERQRKEQLREFLIKTALGAMAFINIAPMDKLWDRR